MGLSQGSFYNIREGTIPANGTLSEVFDVAGYNMLGLLVSSSMTAGTLTAQVAATEDGTYYDLKDNAGANVQLATGSGTFAVSGVALEPLSPFRYIKIKSSVSQGSGLQMTMTLKAH